MTPIGLRGGLFCFWASPATAMAERAETSSKVRGEVVVIRARVATVRINGYDADLPISSLPEDARKGDELELTVRLLPAKEGKPK